MRQDSLNPSTFDQFFTKAFFRLVSWLIWHGIPNGEAEEMAQDILLVLWKQVELEPSRVTDPEGWIFHCAEWRVRDWYRSGRVRFEEALIAGHNSDERDPQFRAPSDDLIGSVWARQLIERHAADFWERVHGDAGPRAPIVDAVRDMMRIRAPGDPVTQFLESRVLVLSGSVKDTSKRDARDVCELASLLAVTTGALRTSFSRIKPFWERRERELFNTAGPGDGRIRQLVPAEPSQLMDT